MRITKILLGVSPKRWIEKVLRRADRTLSEALSEVSKGVELEYVATVNDTRKGGARILSITIPKDQHEPYECEIEFAKRHPPNAI